MRILLTNDDGIYAPGIWALYRELSRFAQVTVVAPDVQRSSVGHGITLAHPLYVHRVNRNKNFFGYAVSGTPADCVKLAAAEILKKKPDMIFSGINLGPNDGCSVFYSGTVAGAREGAMLGIPSVALSLGTFVDPDFSYAASFGARLARRLLKKNIPRGTFLNVNVPAVAKNKIKGVRLARQGKVPIHGEFIRRVDPSDRAYYWMSGKLKGIERDIEVDTYALENKYVTITPILCDLTDYPFLRELETWTVL